MIYLISAIFAGLGFYFAAGGSKGERVAVGVIAALSIFITYII